MMITRPPLAGVLVVNWELFKPFVQQWFSLWENFFMSLLSAKEHFKQLELPENEFGVNEAQKHENPALEKPNRQLT